MSKYSIDQLKACLKKVANRETASLSDKDNLFDGGFLDSLSLIQFIVAIEQELKITFRYSDVQFENFKNLGCLLTLLENEYSTKAV